MNNQNSNHNPAPWQPMLKWLLPPALFGFFLLIVNLSNPVQQEEVPFSMLIENAQARNIKKIYFSNADRSNLKFTLKNRRRLFATRTPANLSLINYLQNNNVSITDIDSEDQAPMSLNDLLITGPLQLLSALVQLLNVLGPLALAFFVFKNVYAQFKRDPQEVGKDYKTQDLAPITFKDVAGAVNAKEELAELVSFLQKPQALLDLGAVVPKGVILYGPPGVGKTLLARAVAGEANVPFIYVSGSEFAGPLMSIGVGKIKQLFQRARDLKQNVIIFIDEIDSVGTRRLMARDAGSMDSNQTLNQLLDEMDGFTKNNIHNIIVIAATNLIEVLDPALTRAGRFDRKIYLGLPEKKDRLAIMNVYAAKIKLAADVCLEDLADLTVTFSGADLALLMNEAAIYAALQNQSSVNQSALLEIYQRQVLGGRLNKTLVLSDKFKEKTAYHEAGHALIGYLTQREVYILSIQPRSNALGVTFIVPDEESQISMSKTHCQNEIKISLAGRAAEEVVYGADYLNSGARADIIRATDIAKAMITKYGFSEDLGFVSYGDLRPGVAEYQRHSELAQAAIDKEVKKIIDHAYQETKAMLHDNLQALHGLARSAIQAGTLNKEEILGVIRTHIPQEELPCS